MLGHMQPLGRSLLPLKGNALFETSLPTCGWLANMEKSLYPTCVACACSVKQRLVRDRLRLFQFLMHLNPELESLQGQLLYHSPIPTLDDALKEHMS